MKAHMGQLIIILTFFGILISPALAQDTDTTENDTSQTEETDIFDDPFSESTSETETEDDTTDIFDDPFLESGNSTDQEDSDLFDNPFGESDSSEASGDENTDLFDDPFGESGESQESSGDENSDSDSNNDPFADPDSLFGGEGPLIEEVEEDPDARSPEEDLLVNEEGIRWSGRFSGSI